MMSITSIPSTDLKKIIKLFNRKVGLLLLLLLSLYFDGTTFGSKYIYSQNIVDIIALIGFVLLYRRSVSRVKKILLYGVIVSLFIEQLLSIQLHMWTYRQSNMPLYAPLGQAVVFARVFVFSKASIVQKYKKQIVKFFSFTIIIYVLIYTILFNDIFGLVLTLGVFVLVLINPKQRVFILTRYIIVVGVELVGTYFQCWYWPKFPFGFFEFLPSANPPSGLGFCYLIIDICFFCTYILLNKATWRRFKKIKRISNCLATD